jgi:hypothetical protein
MPVGHYTLVDSIVRIYLSDPGNSSIIFTNQYGAGVLAPLADEMKGRVAIEVLKDQQKIGDFLNGINQFNLDKIYVVTLDKYFNSFLHFNTNSKLVLFIHNVEDWFRINIFILAYRFFKSFRISASLIYNFKVCFLYPFGKKKLIKKIKKDNNKLAVLNTNIKAELEKYFDSARIEVLPFSVYNPDIRDESGNNQYIRICIPGMVDSVRRDYMSVLKIFEQEADLFKEVFELELLGGIAHNVGGDEIIKYAVKLIAKGLRIIYYNKSYMPLQEFDAKLAKADVILGNMNVVINKFSSYGKTKESGIAYTMIRVAKPGILPESYPMPIELQSSTVTFNSNDDLKSVLKNLAKNKEILNILTSEALKNSLNFAPSSILKNIK